MSPGSSTESYPAFARIGLRKNPGKNLNQVTCPDRDSNPSHLVSRPDALTVTPQVWTRGFKPGNPPCKPLDRTRKPRHPHASSPEVTQHLNQVTCTDRDSNPGHLVSRPDALTVTPQNCVNFNCGYSRTILKQCPYTVRRKTYSTSILAVFSIDTENNLNQHLCMMAPYVQGPERIARLSASDSRMPSGPKRPKCKYSSRIQSS
ncbi:hypothetical protein ANN_21863 [Periplaneta americana]|uniref:Uncharacterized protein n=1 Tax=Periplaneta americana TaxID=6978 RepID=A0ABQ8S6X1_PERAM|nr:hypothetical protein ANN_21863 [Periplaneta americana]